MKFSTSTIILLLSRAIFEANAFSSSSNYRAKIVSRKQQQQQRLDSKLFSSKEEIEELLAQAKKAREDASRLSKELGKEFFDEKEAAAAKASKKLSPEDMVAAISAIPFDGGNNNVLKQITELEKLRSDGQISLYKSANLRTYPVTLTMLESRTKLTGEKLGLGADGEGEVSLEDFKYATLGVTLGSGALGIASLAFLPENIGATFCYFFALIPILFLAVGSTVPAAIASAIVLARKAISGDDSEEDNALKDRIARHEAAHFMCGYLCGLPIVGYNVLQDGPGTGVPRVEFATGGAAQSGFSQDQVASLSITAVSGLVAEAMEYDNVKGAEADLLELQEVFKRSQEFIGAAQQQELTRWGALTSYQLLTQNKAQLEKLIDAFKQKKGISECVSVLEC